MTNDSYITLLLEQCIICEANIERYESGIATCMERVKKLKSAIPYFLEYIDSIKDMDALYIMSEFIEECEWELKSREEDSYRFSGELERNKVTLETLRKFIKENDVPLSEDGNDDEFTEAP